MLWEVLPTWVPCWGVLCGSVRGWPCSFGVTPAHRGLWCGGGLLGVFGVSLHTRTGVVEMPCVAVWCGADTPSLGVVKALVCVWCIMGPIHWWFWCGDDGLCGVWGTVWATRSCGGIGLVCRCRVRAAHKRVELRGAFGRVPTSLWSSD